MNIFLETKNFLNFLSEKKLFDTQLTIRELVDHMLRRQGSINPSDVLTIVSWLRSSPHISNSKLKFRLF